MVHIRSLLICLLFCFGLVSLPINKSYNIIYWNVENSHFNSKAVTRKFGDL